MSPTQPPIIEKHSEEKKEEILLQQPELEKNSSDEEDEKEENKINYKAKFKENETKTKLVLPLKQSEDIGLKILQEFIDMFINPLTPIEEKIKMCIK